MPKRIQRKRSKGWKMPDGAVYVGRPTKFANPFKVGVDCPGAFDAKRQFERWIEGANGTGGGGLRRIALLSSISQLRGKDLACWCPLWQACHADVLLKIANDPADRAVQVGGQAK